MKQKLIAALATKFEGVDANIISRIADNLMSSKTITTEDEVNSAVAEVTFQDILKSYGDSRATEASKTAVSNYEKKHKIKDGKPVNQRQDKQDETDDEDDNEGEDKDGKMPKWAKAMMSNLTAIQQKVEGMEKGKITDSRKAKFSKAIESLPETHRKAYSRTSIDNLSDEDFDSLLNEVATEVAAIVKDTAGKGAGFQPPLGGSHQPTKVEGKEASDKELSDVMAKLNI